MTKIETHNGRIGVVVPAPIAPEYLQPPRTTLEMIDPETAELYLEFNKVNRRLKQTVVEKYARDMSAGRWEMTHEGIAFDVDDNLCDGQHRLKAIMLSGVTLCLLVTRGLPREAKKAMDQGEKRTAVDRLAFEGVRAHQRELAVAKIMLSYKRKSFSHSEIIENFFKHREAITFVQSQFPAHKTRVTTANVMAPIARAWYSQDKERLTRFCEVLYDGVGGEEERIIIVLRDYLMGLKTVSGEITHEIYMKTERALYAFLNNERIRNLLIASRELFPLPDDAQAEPEEDPASLFETMAEGV